MKLKGPTLGTAIHAIHQSGLLVGQQMAELKAELADARAKQDLLHTQADETSAERDAALAQVARLKGRLADQIRERAKQNLLHTQADETSAERDAALVQVARLEGRLADTIRERARDANPAFQLVSLYTHLFGRPPMWSGSNWIWTHEDARGTTARSKYGAEPLALLKVLDQLLPEGPVHS